MDRRSLVTRASVGAAGVAVGLPSVHAQPVLRWRLVSSFPKTLDTIYGAAEVFAQAVRDMTAGRFEITVHAGGDLLPAFGVLDAVQSGTVEMAHTAPYYFYEKNPAFALGSAVPFGFNARQMSAWMQQGNGRRLMDEFYAGYNILSLPGGNTGAQMGGWYLKEIRTASDFKGLKIRVGGGLIGQVMARLGAVPANLPGGDIFRALQTGELDAAEWIGPYDDQKLGLHKVAPYYTYPGWWEGGPEMDFYLHRKAFDALPADYRAIVRAASAQAHAYMLTKYDAVNPNALKQLVTAKVKVIPFSHSVMEAAFRATSDIFASNESQSPEWKKIYADMRDFQRDQVLWYRFAEMRYDAFMSTQKI